MVVALTDTLLPTTKKLQVGTKESNLNCSMKFEQKRGFRQIAVPIYPQKNKQKKDKTCFFTKYMKTNFALSSETFQGGNYNISSSTPLFNSH